MVIIVEHETEGPPAVTAARVGLLDRELRTMQHSLGEDNF